ncbi:hypothetical protein [Streptomyces sp. Mo3]|uniref:hypothetical protein n=1 Tax=Streptomyces sp. Mo3 TaxID=3161190 RepID=UPI0039EF4E54
MLRLVLRVNPVLTTAPVPEEQVPQRGTLRQIAGYLADAVQETAADARGGRRQRARHGVRQAGDPGDRRRRTVKAVSTPAPPGRSWSSCTSATTEPSPGQPSVQSHYILLMVGVPTLEHVTREESDRMTRETASATMSPVFWVAPLAWGVLGLFLLAWTVFEAVKHTGLTIPFGVIGLLVPFLSRLAPGSTAVHHTLLRGWAPLAVMATCSAIPGPADNTALPFTFGMALLTHIALRRARGNGVRSS